MIEFTHETTRYKVKPENAQAIRVLAAKPPKIKIKVDAKNNSMKRDYPIFQAGMTTEDYLKCFNALNSRIHLMECDYTYADRLAPMLDATQPEVWEDLEYIPTMDDLVPLPVKAKKLTTRAALVALIEACEEGDPEQIAAAVIRARGTL